jgi:hypothetical protein
LARHRFATYEPPERSFVPPYHGPGNQLAERESRRTNPRWAAFSSLARPDEPPAETHIADVSWRRRHDRQWLAYGEAMGQEALERQLDLHRYRARFETVGLVVEARPEPRPRQRKLARACRLLRRELAGGERRATELYALAAEAGISKRTFDSAKKLLGVDDTRRSFGGEVWWRPPAATEVRWVPQESALKLLRYERAKARAATRRARTRASA